MLILNNPKQFHDIDFKWIPHQDYSEDGSIIYPRASEIPFKGSINEKKSIIDKVFVDGVERKSLSFVIETVAQLPFKKYDIIIDDTGKKHLLKVPMPTYDKKQTRFLKSNYASVHWLLGVEGDE